MADLRKYPSKKHYLRQQILMLHGLGFVTGDPTIRIGYPFVFHPGVQITVTEPGDSKWIYMMLPVPKGSLITEIKVAYHRTGIQSHISLIRLIEQREPVTASVVHNEKIEKTIPATYILSSPCNVVVNRSILLKVCMEFANTGDMIEFGSIEVRYIPEYASFKENEEKNKKRKEENLVYKFHHQNEVKNEHRPTLAEMFFFKPRKKSILNK